MDKDKFLCVCLCVCFVLRLAVNFSLLAVGIKTTLLSRYRHGGLRPHLTCGKITFIENMIYCGSFDFIIPGFYCSALYSIYVLIFLINRLGKKLHCFCYYLTLLQGCRPQKSSCLDFRGWLLLSFFIYAVRYFNYVRENSQWLII